MGWTSKPSAVCWGTTMQALPCEPTPTPQGRSRMKLHKRWAASWRRSCKQKKDAKYRRGGKTSSPVLFEPIRTFSRVGHGVGQAVCPHFDSHHFQRFCNKKASKTEVFDAFWSCWADSNSSMGKTGYDAPYFFVLRHAFCEKSSVNSCLLMLPPDRV